MRFAIAERTSTGIVLLSPGKTENARFECFSGALETYLKTCGARPEYALFALAGAPIGGRVRLLNHAAWPDVRIEALTEQFGFAGARIENDFAAMARSVPELAETAFDTLVPGEPLTGAPLLVTGPGTGLGVATLLPEPGGRWRVISGEGGHAAYAAQTAREFALVEALQAAGHAYVSNELVCSGSGFDAVREALCAMDGAAYQKLPPQAILDAAARGDRHAREVCDLRAAAIMGAAGDMVLANGTRGGVVLAGGVTLRLIDALRQAEAQTRFRERGPRSDFMRGVPIRVLTDETAPLIGAAALHFDEMDKAR